MLTNPKPFYFSSSFGTWGQAAYRLFIAICAGIIVTRVNTSENTTEQATTQLSNPTALFISAIILAGAPSGAAFIVITPIALNLFLPGLFGLFGLEISTAGLSHAELIIFGGLIVWFLIVEPHGLAKLWAIGKQKLRIWPFPH